jgi:hypothetical protein
MVKIVLRTSLTGLVRIMKPVRYFTDPGIRRHSPDSTPQLQTGKSPPPDYRTRGAFQSGKKPPPLPPAVDRRLDTAARRSHIRAVPAAAAARRDA